MSCAAAMDPAPNAFRGCRSAGGNDGPSDRGRRLDAPGSRTVIASIFKEIRHSDIGGTAALSSILSLLCFPGEVHDEICDLAQEQAEAALKRGRTSGFAALMAGDSAYPPLLACIPDPPPVLWILEIRAASSVRLWPSLARETPPRTPWPWGSVLQPSWPSAAWLS